MPDRAVCLECGYKYPAEQVRTYFVVRDGGDEYPDTQLCDGCADEYRHDDDVDSIEEEQPQPRALVALSDDRQWLVTQEPPYRWRSKLPAVECFYIWRRCGSMMSFHDVIEDTGQDAHQVLAAWMATHEK